MIQLLANALVAFAGCYLIGLGFAALLRPDPTKRFLGSFASSARVHFMELGARIAVGSAMVLSAAQMRFAPAFFAFGWVLIGTSVILLAVPWRLHHRFAKWSVPMATSRMPLLAAGSLLGGGLVLYSLLIGAAS